MTVNRLTGISGMDTESIIKNLMKAESAKMDRLKQQQQYKVWEQEAYRGVIKTLQDFQDSFFNILKPESNFRSASLFAKFSSQVTVGATASTAVSVTGNADITAYEHVISSVTLATKDRWSSAVGGAGVTGVKSADLDFVTGVPDSLQFSLSIDGIAKNITVDMTAISDRDQLVSTLDAQITSAFGATYTGVVSANGTDGIRFDRRGATVKVLASSGFEDSMTWMGITSGAGSLDYAGKPISEVLGITEADLNTMSIGSKSLSFIGITASTSFSEMLVKINNGNMGVKASFSSISDRFVFESTGEGAANALSLSDDLKTKLGLTDHAPGQDAQLVLDGVALTKSSNTFTLEGVTYSLKENYDGAGGDISIKLKVDAGAIKDRIKGFVDSYNTLLADLNGKLSEKFYRDYTPLTDEQKEAMSEDDIKKWEEKSKSGSIRNSSEINTMLTRMRQAIYETVEGAGITMAEIGISTSSNYKENGKLVLDENKLTTALETKYDRVVRLFSASSDKAYLESGTAAERYRENGIGNRLHDILQDAIRTSRDSGNKKGSLLEKAGTANDASFYKNTLTDAITNYEDRISNLLEALANKEDSYYNLFARMESALNQMNNQASWLSSQLGGGNS